MKWDSLSLICIMDKICQPLLNSYGGFKDGTDTIKEKHSHELIVSVTRIPERSLPQTLEFSNQAAVISRNSRLYFWRISVLTYSNRGDISLRPGKQTNKAIRLWVNKVFQATAAHTLPSPVRNKSCGILRVLPKPKRGHPLR